MTIDLDKLEALAKAATPAPWEVAERTVYEHDDTEWWVKMGGPDGVEDSTVLTKENAVYIAAASPDVVLELIGQIRMLELQPVKRTRVDPGEVALASVRLSEMRMEREKLRAALREALEQWWAYASEFESSERADRERVAELRKLL